MKAEGTDLAPLARRIERAHAAQLERSRVARVAGSAALEVGGGLAVCHGPRSPYSAAVGVGLGSTVTPADVDRIESVLGIGGGPVRIEVIPCTDPSLTEELGRRGYQLERFFQVWVHAPGGTAPSGGARGDGPGPEVRPATAAEAATWVELFSRSHLGAPTQSEAQREALTALLRADGTQPWLALEDGAPVGVALASCEGGVSWLSGAGVLPGWRGRRVQAALVEARVARALDVGCDLVAAAAGPGTASQRTLERCGFRVAYPKAVMVR